MNPVKIDLFHIVDRFYRRDEIARMCGDPTTRPDLLTALVQKRPMGAGPYPGTQPELLASNPGVPIESLLLLLHSYTAEVLSNPAFRIHLVGDPHFLDELPIVSRAVIAGCQNTEAGIIRYLAASRSRPVRVRISAALNPKTPNDLLADYVRHAWPVRAALALNPRMPKHVQERLARDSKRIVRCNLAQRHDLLEETVEILVSGKPASVDEQLLRNTSVSDETRERIYMALGCHERTTIQRYRKRLRR